MTNFVDNISYQLIHISDYCFVIREKSNFERELISPIGYGDTLWYLPKKKKELVVVSITNHILDKFK